MKNFVTIAENVQAEIIEKKSKFIANIIKVESRKEAEDTIKKYKKKYQDARHNCVAYRVLEEEKIIEKASDDGEPSGTAGAPILTILQKNKVANVLVIVTRYFGGILLGTGGLVRAYSEATIKAIEKAVIVEKILGIEAEVTLDYNQFDSFTHYCKINQIAITKINYLENIVCKIELEESKKGNLLVDFETKKINLKDLQVLSKKYILKSIIK